MKNIFSCLFAKTTFCSRDSFCNRYASLVNRLMRLRSTAFLKFRLPTATPKRSLESGIAFGKPSATEGVGSRGSRLPSNAFPAEGAGSGETIEGEMIYKILKGKMEKLLPSLNNCSICFRLLSLSFLPKVNCFAK